MPGDSHGYFSLLTSNTPVAQLADFYEKELPKLGWTLRYSDNNFQGGLTNTGNKITCISHSISFLQKISWLQEPDTNALTQMRRRISPKVSHCHLRRS